MSFPSICVRNNLSEYIRKLDEFRAKYALSKDECNRKR